MSLWRWLVGLFTKAPDRTAEAGHRYPEQERRRELDASARAADQAARAGVTNPPGSGA
jgi:hypothetical protein